MSLFWCLFPSCTFSILCSLLLLFSFCQVCLHVKETAEIETGIAGKSSWDQANIRQKLGLVWINRKKLSQIIKDYFYLRFFLLISLWVQVSAYTCRIMTPHGSWTASRVNWTPFSINSRNRSGNREIKYSVPIGTDGCKKEQGKNNTKI